MKALLIRHAATTGQAPDAPLTPAGQKQAEALVPVLTELKAGPLYTSPYTRAQDTIGPYAKASGQSVTALDDLRERLLSTDDRPDWQHHVRRSLHDALYTAPGGESHTHLFVRAAHAFDIIAEEGGPLPTFVTHGGMTTALLNRVDPTFGHGPRMGLHNPDLFEVTIQGRQITAFARIALPVQA